MKPPWLGRAILWLCLPASERESIPGDLLEEFVTRGGDARHWYLRQALRSAIPALGIRWRRGEAQELLALILILFIMPFAILLGGGTFVLSHVPRKADPLEASVYLTVSLGVSAFCVLIGWLFQKRIGGKS